MACAIQRWDLLTTSAREYLTMLTRKASKCMNALFDKIFFHTAQKLKFRDSQTSEKANEAHVKSPSQPDTFSAVLSFSNQKKPKNKNKNTLGYVFCSSIFVFRKKLPPIVDLVCHVCKIPKFLCEIVKSKCCYHLFCSNFDNFQSKLSLWRFSRRLFVLIFSCETALQNNGSHKEGYCRISQEQ